jgi:hypothetical protein
MYDSQTDLIDEMGSSIDEEREVIYERLQQERPLKMD